MRRDAPTAQITSPNREPRIAVAIIYPTGSIYITNRTGIANVPGNVIHGALKDLSASSQDLYPDQGRSTIGTLSFAAVDIDDDLTSELRTQLLTNDRGLNLREVRVITGDTDDFTDWQDNRVDTYVVTGVSREGRSYRFSCADRTREQRVSIFEQQKTRLASTITATDSTINVLSTAGFEMLAHTAAFSDAPSATVGYFRIRQTGETIRYTGKTSTSFTGCTRGVFNTVAQPVVVEATEDDRKPEVEEFIYLEMPAPDMLHAIQTGEILSSSATMPARWHMGIDEAYIDAAGYGAIGTDLYDPADPAAGLVLRFVNLQKEDGKKFVEEQLHVPMGTYPIVDAYGVIGIRRIASIVATASPQFVLTDANVISHGAIQHSLARVINRLIVNWNHDGEDFTRTNIILNNNSIDVHGASKPLTLNLRGIHVSNHSTTTIQRIANYYFERYGAPPIEGELVVSRALNNVEIGDVGQVALQRVPDFAGASYLSRAIEVQSRQVNWKTGATRLRMFASTARTVPDAGGGTTAVLPDGFYTATGTELSTVLTISAGAVTANGALTGGTDARTAVFYYDGNLTINAGVTVTITGNVQLRIKGTLTVNGSIDGAGGGLAGLSDPNTVSAAMIASADQLDGFIGASRGSDGLRLRTFILTLPVNVETSSPPISRAVNAALPQLNIAVEGSTVEGLPAELRGAPGGWGGAVYDLQNDGTTVVRALGGDGGDGGAGLLLICRGLAFGVSGEIDLSGANGSAGGVYTAFTPDLHAGGGGGGAPGALVVLLDGDNVTYPDLSSAFLANQGTTTQTGTPMTTPSMRTSDVGATLTGLGPGTPVEDRWEANHAIVYVPSDIELGESDDELVPSPSGLVAVGVDTGAQLVWISPPSNQHDFIEVWRATTNDRTGAVLVYRGKTNSYFESSSTVVTRYFWIRAARESGGYSAWHPVGSTSGVSARYGGAARPRNMLVVESWTAGDVPGSVGNFFANETASNENQIINAIGPFGSTELVWEGRCTDAVGSGGEANGGWNNSGDLQGLDSSKSYRSVVWVKRTANTNVDNHFFFGASTTDTYDLGGSANSNPYFINVAGGSHIGVTLPVFDKWYLCVGIIHGDDYAGGDTGQSGVYDPETGRRVFAGTEYRMAPGATAQAQRVYMFYGGNTDVRLYWAKPRFEAIDGNEPPISALLTAGQALDWRNDFIYDEFAYLDSTDLYKRWVLRDGGPGEITSITGLTDAPGGNAVRFGNNSGNDEWWGAFKEYLVPFDPDGLYEVGVVARKLTGSGLLLCGVEGVANDRITLINSVGGASASQQHYAATAGANLGTSWETWKGYIKGHSASAGGQANDPSSPAPMYTGVAYIRPLLIANYDDAAGQTEVAALWLRRIGGALSGRDTVGTPEIDDEAATEIAAVSEAFDFRLVGDGTTDTYVVLSASVDVVPEDVITVECSFLLSIGANSWDDANVAVVHGTTVIGQAQDLDTHFDKQTFTLIGAVTGLSGTFSFGMRLYVDATSSPFDIDVSFANINLTVTRVKR